MDARRAAALPWIGLAGLFGLLLASWILHRAAGARSLWRLGLGLFEAFDEVHGIYLLTMLEAPLMLLAMLLGFGAVVAYPVLMLALGVGMARATWRGREWALVATLVLLVVLALGSAWDAVRPEATYGRSVWGDLRAPSPALRVLGGAIAVGAAAFAAWLLRALRRGPA